MDARHVARLGWPNLGALGVVAAVAVGAACSSTTTTEPAKTNIAVTTSAGTTAPPVPPAPRARTLGAVALATRPVADIPLATAMATRPADGSIYITTQPGQVWRLPADGTAATVLDLAGTVSEWLPGSERGLLGIAFSPIDGRMFLYYTDLEAQSHLVSYAVGRRGNPDPDSVWEVMEIEQPGAGHKGGGLAFDESGILYLALGDGGGSSGRDAQDPSKLHGGIVRIVPSTEGPGYDVPPDNPFIGDASTRPELWAKGLRNPWGFWRDPLTGDLWIADVGQNDVEELNRIPSTVSGVNFGWYFLEGDEVRFDGAPPDAVAPIFTYRHDEVGPAIIGGRVYRGTAIRRLVGAYVFADMSGPLFAVGARNQVRLLPLSIPHVVITGFGEGPDGELYILTLEGGVLKLVPG